MATEKLQIQLPAGAALQVPFSGFGMMTRAIHTIAVTRIIRTVAFMLTVLPSQRPGCFGRRFPKARLLTAARTCTPLHTCWVTSCEWCIRCGEITTGMRHTNGGARWLQVPSSWWRFLVIGFTQLRASGGWCVLNSMCAGAMHLSPRSTAFAGHRCVGPQAWGSFLPSCARDSHIRHRSARSNDLVISGHAIIYAVSLEPEVEDKAGA